MGTGLENLPFETFETEMIDPLKGIDLKDNELLVAGLILDAKSNAPIKMAEIAVAAWHQRTVNLTDRQIRTIVRSLRRNHGFPICTRKGAPAGYWWARTEAELEEFVNVWKSQYLDEAQTLHIMLKTNCPRLAGQMRLELEA